MKEKNIEEISNTVNEKTKKDRSNEIMNEAFDKTEDDIKELLRDKYNFTEDELEDIDLINYAKDYDILSTTSDKIYQGDFSDLSQIAFQYSSFDYIKVVVLDLDQGILYRDMDQTGTELTEETNGNVITFLKDNKVTDWKQHYDTKINDDESDGGFEWSLIFKDQSGDYYTYSGSNDGMIDMQQFSLDLDQLLDK